MPISAPIPNSPPSVNRVDALLYSVEESTLAKKSDVVLLTASDEKQFRLGAMGSRIAQLLVVDFLSLELALHDLEHAEENVIRTHQMVHRQ